MTQTLEQLASQVEELTEEVQRLRRRRLPATYAPQETWYISEGPPAEPGREEGQTISQTTEVTLPCGALICEAGDLYWKPTGGAKVLVASTAGTTNLQAPVGGIKPEQLKGFLTLHPKYKAAFDHETFYGRNPTWSIEGGPEEQTGAGTEVTNILQGLNEKKTAYAGLYIFRLNVEIRSSAGGYWVSGETYGKGLFSIVHNGTTVATAQVTATPADPTPVLQLSAPLVLNAGDALEVKMKNEAAVEVPPNMDEIEPYNVEILEAIAART